MQAFKPLSYETLDISALLIRPTQMRSRNVDLHDPAVRVMTDLRNMVPFTIERLRPIDEANQKMIACGVRLLFVSDDAGEIEGLITATDILGEKPVKFLQEHGGTRESILVEDIMTPRNKLEALRLHDVERARVGDIVETMKMFGRQHVLVIAFDIERRRETVCGLFSTSQIIRQLGMEIVFTERANTFAEIESVLASA